MYELVNKTVAKRQTNLPAARRGLTAVKAHLRHFRDSDDGAMSILSLFLFIAFMIMAGLGIDTMRHEMERARLQMVLDSAVLAAAGAPDGEDPGSIVQDYFAKNDMLEHLDSFQEGDIVTTLSSTRVSARASMDVKPYLMNVESLTASGAATAEMRVPKLEIALVLDVSGSMNDASLNEDGSTSSKTKLEDLKVAAKDFVTTIMNSSAPGSTVISIVPFSTSVTPSDGLFEELAVNITHDYSTCVYLEESDYNQPALATAGSSSSSGSPVKQAIYTSVFGEFDDLDAPGQPRDFRSCYTDEYMRILPYSISQTQLHNKIDALVGRGNTSTDQGIKFGTALLDPHFRSVSAGLIATGEVDSSLGYVPTNYSTDDTMKVLIIMGDGANSPTYFYDQSPPTYRGDNSDLYKVVGPGIQFDYAFKKRNKDRRYYSSSYEQNCSKRKWRCEYKASGAVGSYYYLHDTTPSGDNDYYNTQTDEWITADMFAALDNLQGFKSKDPLSWEMAWGLMSTWYYSQKVGHWDSYYDYVTSEFIDGATKNSRMESICNTANAHGVYVYTIGFQVPKDGTAEEYLKKCATSNAHYFRAEGVSITDAFSAIAGNVEHLRLTQ